VAEPVPRSTSFDDLDRYPDYFSAETFWRSKELWNFLGIPFHVVTTALRDVAKEFRKELTEGLRGLLPGMRDEVMRGKAIG